MQNQAQFCPYFWSAAAQTFNQGHLYLDVSFTPGVSTDQNVDLLISCDHVVGVYLQKRAMKNR